MEPCISVIIPMYKVEAYLCRCLDSVCGQTYRNLEIIAVDDGSPDKCGEIAEEYAQKDNRVKVFHQENQGLSEARNHGIKFATGEWIFFVDSDDALPADAIQILWDAAKKEQVAMSMGGYYVCISKKTDVKRKQVHVHNMVLRDAESMQSYFLSKGKNFNYVWMKLYRKEIFDYVKFEKGKYYEDIYAFPDIIEKAGSIAIIDIPVYHYYLQYNSISFGNDMRKHMDGLYARENWKKQVEKQYPQLLAYSADAVLEFCCYLLGKISFLGRKKNSEYWEKVTKAFNENQKLAAKESIYLRAAVCLYRISPVLLGKLCNLYSKMKRM